jgi:hypothetical protein
MQVTYSLGVFAPSREPTFLFLTRRREEERFFMIKSLLIANRGEIDCRIIRSQILPGTGRCPVRVEGSGEGWGLLQGSRFADSGPSVRASPCHLPQRAVGGFWVSGSVYEILPELVSERGTARVAGGGGVSHV